MIGWLVALALLAVLAALEGPYVGLIVVVIADRVRGRR